MENYKYKVLSIDGGGIRGILAARMLKEIEVRTEKPISHLFDLITGTSTGGLLAIASAMGDDFNIHPLFSADEMIDLYKLNGEKIFYRSFYDTVTSVGGLRKPKYERESMDELLDEYFGDATLADTMVPICLTSYDLNTAAPRFWSTFEPYADKYKLADIAGATSAAPTYFSPKAIEHVNGEVHYHVDGGVVVNNPQIVALLQMMVHVPSIKKEDIMLVSVGTGSKNASWDIDTLKDGGILDWISGGKLIDLFMDGNNDFADFSASLAIPNRFRLQPEIDSSMSAMDNYDPENIQNLLDVADQYIAKHDAMFDHIAMCLLDKCSPDAEYTQFNLDDLVSEMAGEVIVYDGQEFFDPIGV